MTALNLIQMAISVILVVTILIQVKGQGGGLFGSAEGSFRTRRGIEKTIFQFTIFLVAAFVLVSIVSASSRIQDFFAIDI